MAGAPTLGAGLLEGRYSTFAEEGPEEKSGRLTPGDAGLLRFAAASEILETDFWVQYNELAHEIDARRRKELDDKALDEVQKENKRLDEFKNKFLPSFGEGGGGDGEGKGPGLSSAFFLLGGILRWR